MEACFRYTYLLLADSVLRSELFLDDSHHGEISTAVSGAYVTSGTTHGALGQRERQAYRDPAARVRVHRHRVGFYKYRKGSLLHCRMYLIFTLTAHAILLKVGEKSWSRLSDKARLVTKVPTMTTRFTPGRR